QTIAFLQEVDLVREAGLAADTLEGICRHRGPAIDADAWSALAEGLFIALNALPNGAAQNGSAASSESKPEAARERERLAVLQTLSAQLSAPEPLVTTLVSNVLKVPDGPAKGRPLIEEIMGARTAALTAKLNEWYVWFPAA